MRNNDNNSFLGRLPATGGCFGVKGVIKISRSFNICDVGDFLPEVV